MKAITIDRQRRARARQWLQRYQRPVRSWLLGALAAALCNVVATVLQLGLMAWLIQRILVDQVSVSQLLKPAMALACAVLLRALSQALHDYCAQRRVPGCVNRSASICCNAGP